MFQRILARMVTCLKTMAKLFVVAVPLQRIPANTFGFINSELESGYEEDAFEVLFVSDKRKNHSVMTW